jgi:NADPH-dependent curcumin reductase CurA
LALVAAMTVLELKNAPREVIGLLKGENFGKKLIRVSLDSTRR